MAKISIANLNANESKFSLLPLGETELIKTAVERALDTRRIGGGINIKIGYFLQCWVSCFNRSDLGVRLRRELSRTLSRTLGRTLSSRPKPNLRLSYI